MKTKLDTLLIAFSICLGLIAHSYAQTVPAVPAKNFQLTSLKGEPVELANYKDQAVLLVFWATWCPYCKKLLPGVERLHQTYKDQGLTVFAVNVMEDDDPKAYIEKYGYSFTVLLEGDSLKKDYGVMATPTIGVLTKNNIWSDYLQLSDPNSKELENAVRKALGLKPL